MNKYKAKVTIYEFFVGDFERVKLMLKQYYLNPNTRFYFPAAELLFKKDKSDFLVSILRNIYTYTEDIRKK